MKSYFQQQVKDYPILNATKENYNPKLYAKSTFNTPLAPYHIENELYKFRNIVTEIHYKLPSHPYYNITKVQRNVLTNLRNNPSIVILRADKGLWITTFYRDEYIKSMLDQHLIKGDNYRKLTPTEAHSLMAEASSKTIETITKYEDEISPNNYVLLLRQLRINKIITQMYGDPKLFKGKENG